jgi:hypothetical protein
MQEKQQQARAAAAKMNVSRPASIKQGPKAKEGHNRFPTTDLPKPLRGKRKHAAKGKR